MAEINVNNTTYNVTEDWLKIAAKYFEIDQNSQQSINMLKAGLFGYNNEIQSNEIKNNVYHRNVLYDEHFVNTASFPESINNFAKLYDVSIETATPAHLKAVMTINKLDIINNPYVEVEESENELGQRYSNHKLILNNGYKFNIEGINFMLPYPIRFDIKEISGGYNILASYVLDEDNNFPYIDIESPYIKTWSQTMVDSEDYILINIDLFQLEASETEVLITSNDLLDNMYIDNDFFNQLAYVTATYTENGVTETLAVEQNDRIFTKNGKRVCYLTVVDDDTFRISFSSNNRGFKPALNSKFNLKYYTTLGEGGNFSYSGSITVNFNNQGEFDKIPVTITPSSDSTGGKNKLGTDEIKSKVVEAALTRSSYITDKDLEYYFNNFNDSYSVNGSRISFIKKRNDLLRRVFGGHLLLRDADKKIIPTNTANAMLIPNNFGSVINESARVILDVNTEYNPKFYLTNSDNEIASDGEPFKVVDLTDGSTLYYQLREFTNNDGTVDTKPVVIRRIYTKLVPRRNDPKEEWGTIETIYWIDEYGVIHNHTPAMYINDNGTYSKIDLKDNVISNDELPNVSNLGGTTFTAEFGDVAFVSYLGEIAVANPYTRDEMDGEMSTNGLLIYWDPDINGNDAFTISRSEMPNLRFYDYSIPYTIKLITDKQPIKSRYYNMVISDNYKFKTEYVNEGVVESFILNSFNIYKFPKEFTYTISVNLNTNLDESALDDCVEIRAIVYNIASEAPIGFIKFNRIEATTVYEAVLTTNMDKINEEDQLLVQGIYNLNTDPNNPLSFSTDAWLENEIGLSVAVLYKDPDGILESYKYGDYANISGVISNTGIFPDTTTAIVYRTTSNVVLFNKLEQYMESNLVMSKNPSYSEDETAYIKSQEEAGVPIPQLEREAKYYTLKSVPLVEYSYYEQYYMSVNELISKYHETTKEIIDKLENNNTVDIKFYNTYGVSNNWRKDVENETNKQVDNVAMSLEFTIYTNQTVSDVEDLLIKEFISNFVERANSTGIFAMSNLLRALENNFSYIIYVEFGLIDDSDIQKIYSVEKDPWEYTNEEIISYVPEFINVKKSINSLSTAIAEFDDTGTFIYNTYDYDINIKYV